MHPLKVRHPALNAKSPGMLLSLQCFKSRFEFAAEPFKVGLFKGHNARLTHLETSHQVKS